MPAFKLILRRKEFWWGKALALILAWLELVLVFSIDSLFLIKLWLKMHSNKRISARHTRNTRRSCGVVVEMEVLGTEMTDGQDRWRTDAEAGRTDGVSYTYMHHRYLAIPRRSAVGPAQQSSRPLTEGTELH